VLRNVFIRKERKRADLAGTVAGRAVLENDWSDVLAEGGSPVTAGEKTEKQK